MQLTGVPKLSVTPRPRGKTASKRKLELYAVLTYHPNVQTQTGAAKKSRSGLVRRHWPRRLIRSVSDASKVAHSNAGSAYLIWPDLQLAHDKIATSKRTATCRPLSTYCCEAYRRKAVDLRSVTNLIGAN